MRRMRAPQLRRRTAALGLLASAAIVSITIASGDDAPSSGPAGTTPPDQVTFDGHIRPFVETYCLRCHSTEKQKAGLDLEVHATSDSVIRDRKTWEKVHRMLSEREMPPGRRRQPSEEERFRVTSWIRAELDRFDCDGPVDPGHVTLRRLNRAEYNNTVRDLLGIDFEPAADFPADEVGYGFDNIGDVLSLPPLLLEKYLDAAIDVVERALARERRLADGERTSAAFERVVTCSPGDGLSPAECARRILGPFAERAFRRPLSGAELDGLVNLSLGALEAGDEFEQAIEVGLAAALVSPHFLFRVEAGLAADGGSSVAHPIGDFELASRLSYFIWSSMPDDELLASARAGKLHDDAELERQTRRMLADPRSRALVENFASQWLQTRLLERATPDPETYPGFSAELRADMERETILFFDEVLRKDRSVLDFIDGDFTYLNERLARHYGVDGVAGDQFRRVSLEDSPRGGILTHASVLTLTSNPTRTSPVKRGKWVLEQIMGTPPPPPPPDVPELSEEPEAILSGSLRQRMERHRDDPNCAQCHARMDPIGFAFENFDGVGRWRDFDGQFVVDPSGELPDGRSFDGPDGLKKILRAQHEVFCRNLVEKMLTYALGRGLEYYDKCAVDRVVEALERNDHRPSALIVEIVKTDPFRKRRGRDTEDR